MAYDFAGRDVGSAPGFKTFLEGWLQQQGYYKTGKDTWATNNPGVDMTTGAALLPMFLNSQEMASTLLANPNAWNQAFPTLGGTVAEYLNTYYGGPNNAAQEIQAAGGTLPTSYVQRKDQAGGWVEGPVDIQGGGGSMVWDPNAVTPGLADFYKAERGEALGLADWNDPANDWELYMGDPTRSGAGKWQIGPGGQLQWVASSPVKNDPNAHTWFQNAVGPTFADLLTTLVPTIIGNAIYPGVGGAAGNFVGQLITPGITERGGPNWLQMGLAAVAPALGEALSGAFDWASGTLSSLGTEAAAEGALEGGMTVGGEVFGSAEELFSEGVLDTVLEEAPGALAEITPTVDLGRDITGIEMGMTPESPLGPGISDVTMEATGSMGSTDTVQAITDFLTNPETWRTAAQVGEAGLNIYQGIQGSNPDFGPLPELLTAGSPPPELPALDKTMPAGPSWEFPARAEYPEITSSYFPRNWDSMSDAERQAWLIQRGRSAASRKRRTYAGNLLGMRGGTDLTFAELTGSYPGAQLLGG